MNELLVSVMPATLWLMACAFVILLLLVLFGYHAYQRSRMKAMLSDGGSVAELAAKKDLLEKDLEQLRQTLAVNRAELLKQEAERRQQEIFRVELGRLEKETAEKRKQCEGVLANLAGLDNQVTRRKQALGQLDAQIGAMERRREELEPTRQSLQELRAELERGNVKLAQLAEHELKVGAMMHQARDLAREIEDLTHTLEPLRNEKNRLRQFVEQARHSTAVRNEQLLDQKREIHALEQQKFELETRIAELTRVCDELAAREQENQRHMQRQAEDAARARDEAQQQLAELDAKRESAESEMAGALQNGKKELDNLLNQIQLAQTQLEQLLLRKDERVAEVASLSGRVAVLGRELDNLTAQIPGPEKARSQNTVRKRESQLWARRTTHRGARTGPRRNVEVIWKKPE